MEDDYIFIDKEFLIIKASENSSNNELASYYPRSSSIFFDKNDQICPICLKPLPKDVSRPQICSHTFCHNCLIFWSKKKKIFPICRKSFINIIFF